MYHKVASRAHTDWWVDSDTFYRQMHDLQDRKVVSLDQYDPSDPSHVVITFDGVYRNVLLYAAPILKHFGYPFEMFVTGDHIGGDNSFDPIEPRSRFADPEELRRMVLLGGRLQWHTRTHSRLCSDSQSKDWDRTLAELDVPAELRELDPKGFNWFAYPHGDFSEDVYEAVRQRFDGAVSCVQGNAQDRYRLNRLTVTNATVLRQQRLALIVVSYNYGAYLAEAIESVLCQTCQPDEILVMDDGSSDNTPEVAQKYGELYPERIRYERNERNLGIVETFNKAVSLTSSELICFLGADNRLVSNYLERCVSALNLAGDQTAIAYTDFALFGDRAADEYGRHAAERRGRILDNAVFEVVFPSYSPEAARAGDYIHGSSVFRRNAFDRVGGYLSKTERPEDSNLFRRIQKAGYAAVKATGTWLEYRQHSEDQANIVARTRQELAFYRVYTRRLEFKVRVLERSFGLLSPLVRLLSILEKATFEQAVRLARWWRRRL